MLPNLTALLLLGASISTAVAWPVLPTPPGTGAYNQTGNGVYVDLAQFRANVQRVNEAMGIANGTAEGGFVARTLVAPLPPRVGYSIVPAPAAVAPQDIYLEMSAPLGLGESQRRPVIPARATSRTVEVDPEQPRDLADPAFQKALKAYRKNEARWREETNRIDDQIREQQRKIAHVNRQIEQATGIVGDDQVPTRRVTRQTGGVEAAINQKHDAAIAAERAKIAAEGGEPSEAALRRLDRATQRIERTRSAELATLDRDVARRNARLDALRRDRDRADAKVRDLEGRKKTPPKPPRPPVRRK